MMRSLYSGVSGLKVHQTRMDVLGNNISNVNTVGFKASTVNFSELFYQTTQVASGPNRATGNGGQNAKQIGLGASLSAINVNIVGEGGTQTTSNPFDLKINGSAFFVVQNSGTNYFTKAGNFTTDEEGNLVTASGAYVMGFTSARNETTGDFELQTDQLRPLSIYGSQYSYTPPAATTQTSFTGNINEEDDTFSTGDGTKTVMMYAYDNKGYRYGVQVTLKPTGTRGEYEATAGKVFLGNKESANVTAAFTPATFTLNYKESDGTWIGINNTAGTDTVTLTLTDATVTDTPFEPITVDFSQTTSFGSESTIESKPGDKDGNGAGKAVGNMDAVGIQPDGRIIATYDNGDIAVIGQLRVAEFINPAGLEKVGDNMFAATMNSGEFDGMGLEIYATGGKFSTSTLEMSNVDLASEFTDMIVTQRGFQANSRVITTSDTMIEELLSLKR